MVEYYRKGAAGFSEQYSDGKAARVWEAYIGGTQRRTDQYRRWIVDLLRDNGCRHVLDTACGTGYAQNAGSHSVRSGRLLRGPLSVR